MERAADGELQVEMPDHADLTAVLDSTTGDSTPTPGQILSGTDLVELQGQAMVIHPDDFGQRWNIRFSITPVIRPLIQRTLF